MASERAWLASTALNSFFIQTVETKKAKYVGGTLNAVLWMNPESFISLMFRSHLKTAIRRSGVVHLGWITSDVQQKMFSFNLKLFKIWNKNIFHSLEQCPRCRDSNTPPGLYIFHNNLLFLWVYVINKFISCLFVFVSHMIRTLFESREISSSLPYALLFTTHERQGFHIWPDESSPIC